MELVINNHANGKHYLYDVVNIKENAGLSRKTAVEIQSRLDGKALHSPRTIANPSADVNADSEVRASRLTSVEDASYMDAVKRGDMETAARMVREAAAKTGYKRMSAIDTLRSIVAKGSQNQPYDNKRERKAFRLDCD